MFGKNIKQIRESNNIGVNELSRLSGVNASYISALERDEKKNPSVTILEKLANALNVNVDELMKTNNVNHSDIEEFDEKYSGIKEDVSLYESGEFKTPEDAMKFILKQPTIMGYGGFDVSKLSNEDIIEFANDLLKQLKLLSYKYNK